MYAETVKQGAAVVRRTAKKNPMELLVSIIEGDPTADADRLFKKWLDVVREDEDYFVPALRHAFSNLLNSLDHARRQSKASGKVWEQSQAVRAQKVKAAVSKVASIIFMNLLLPNGKLLRDATFKDCAAAGGWFAKVARKGKPNQVVGKILTEDKLRAL